MPYVLLVWSTGAVATALVVGPRDIAAFLRDDGLPVWTSVLVALLGLALWPFVVLMALNDWRRSRGGRS